MDSISDYVESTLKGISADRIVSISHSMGLLDAPGFGKSPAWYSVLVVIRRSERDAEASRTTPT
jgi:hypothetical protein